MLKILKQPKWIVLTIVLIFTFYAFINLSEWQFSRNEERIDKNSEITSSLNQEVRVIDNVKNLEQLKEWNSVELKGHIEISQLKFARNRYLESSLGFWAIAPLTLPSQDKILINLGFVPINYQSNLTQIELTKEQVIIKGWLRKVELHKETPADYPDKQISSISSENFDVNSKTFYVQIYESNSEFENITFLPPPTISNGPHLSYAIQWIIFAFLLPIGWVILYRSEKSN